MNLGDVAGSPLVFEPGTPVSKLVSKLFQERATEALVFENGRYLGIIQARDLVKRNIQDPDKTKLDSLKAIIRKVTPFPADAGLEDVVQSILTNGYKSVPVKRGDDFLVATKLDILKLFPRDVLKNKKVKDVMVFPYCVGAGDTLAVARSVLRQMGAIRVAVINEKGGVEGMIETLDLLNSVITTHRDTGQKRHGEGRGDKIHLGEILASSKTIMQSTFVRMDQEAPLTDVVKKMLDTKTSTIVVEDGRFHGIVTPTEIFRLLKKEVSGIYVQVTGQQKEDIFIRSVVDEELRNEIQKLAKTLPIEYMTLHIDRHNPEGKRVKYTVKAKIVTEKGVFYAHAHAWDLTKAIHELLDRFERDIYRKKEKSRDYTRRGRFIRQRT